jgi:hypothetical protein
MLLLDIEGAFDNAWHPGILARLWELKCPKTIYCIVKDFLKDRNAYIRLGDATSFKQVTRGCPQGSVSGPTLWTIIISDLIAVLSKVPNLNCVTFADDILLMSQSHSHTDVITTVLTTLRIAEDWCKIHKLEISRDKTSLMPMFIRNRDTYKYTPK